MRRLILIALLSACNFAGATDIDVKSAWVRGTVEGQKRSGAFMTITSKQNAALVGAASPVAGVVEVHEMKMAGDRMLMRAIPRLELPAGKPVDLSRGGYHIMLMELRQTLKPGQKVPLELKIEGADKKVRIVKMEAEVRDLTAGDSSGGGHHHHH